MAQFFPAGERRFDLFSQRLSDICYLETVTAAEIQAGKVCRDRFEIFIMPGGYVSVTHAALGPNGEKALSEFVHAGGGWLGSCLGGFIPSLPYAAVLGVQQLDEEHWERGLGTVKVEITEEGMISNQIELALHDRSSDLG